MSPAAARLVPGRPNSAVLRKPDDQATSRRASSEEVVDGVVDERSDGLRGDALGGDHGDNAPDGGGDEECGAGGIGGRDPAARDAFLDQPRHDRECVGDGRVSAREHGTRLGGEHEADQVGPADREVDVRRCDGAESGVEGRPGRPVGGAEGYAESGESALGKGVQQRLPIREVGSGRAVADTDPAGEVTQRELLDAAVLDAVLGCLEERVAQVAVVVLQSIGDRSAPI